MAPSAVVPAAGTTRVSVGRASSSSSVRGRPRLRAPRAIVRAAAEPRAASSSPKGEGDDGVRGEGASPSSGETVGALKKRLLAEVAASRKPGADRSKTKRLILAAVKTLEATAAEVGEFGDVSGRWSLVYSTSDAGSSSSPALGPLAAVLDDDAFQRVSNQLYKLFFSFAPALAGSAETGARGVSNEQVVDLAAGRVVNNVDVELPIGGAARIGVEGEIRAVDPEAREVIVTFTEWELGPGGGEGMEVPRLRLPLPRPRGILKNTFCDATLRVSRGGRGGVFITSRLPPSASSE